MNVQTLPSKGRYVPGKDRPRYTDKSGPHRDPVGGTVKPDTPVAVAPGALGLPNSPEKNRLVNELLAPGLPGAARLEQRPPSMSPCW